MLFQEKKLRNNISLNVHDYRYYSFLLQQEAQEIWIWTVTNVLILLRSYKDRFHNLPKKTWPKYSQLLIVFRLLYVSSADLHINL